MFIFKSVVGKLWLTIIGLVVVVLLILSLFLGQFIDSIFSNSKDQRIGLERMAVKVADELSVHSNEMQYIEFVNHLLNAEDAGMILVLPDHREVTGQPSAGEPDNLKASDIFSQTELDRVFAGASVYGRFTAPQAGFKNDEFVSVGVPFRSGGQNSVSGAVVLYQSVQTQEYTQWHVKLLFFYVSVIGFLMTTFFAFFLSTRITRPLRHLKKAADLISVGEYETRVPVHSTDEIGELAKTFNHMAQELKQTIEDLNHEKEHLSSVLRSMTDAVITFDAEGNVILTNPQGRKIVDDWSGIQWGGDEADMMSISEMAEIRQIPEPLKPMFDLVVGDALEHTSNLHVMDGVWSVVMAPLYSNDVVRGAVAVLRDVTEEFRLDKLRKDFVANVSHELRTPLSMLQGYSEALLDDIAGTPEERKELAQVIYEESLRMGRLVKDLLDLARMEAGHMQLNLREVSVNAFVQRVYRKFSALAKEKGLAISCTVPESDIVLEQADEDRLEQVLTNLLDNAIRHTPKQSGISIEAEAVRRGKEQDVLIEIKDQGQGIPAEDLPYIFERFYKADKARTRDSTGGTGLGLAIVKNIVEAHGGKIHVTSTVGQGTTFSIILPANPRPNGKSR